MGGRRGAGRWARLARACAAGAALGGARGAGEGSAGDPLLWGQAPAGEASAAGCRSVELAGVPGFEHARSFGNCGCTYVDARTLDRATFEQDFNEARRPVVLTHATEGWPGADSWGAGFFQQSLLGDRRVSIEGGDLANPCKEALVINEKHRYDFPYVGYELDDFLQLCISDYNGAERETPAAALEDKNTTLGEFALAALEHNDAGHFANRLPPGQVSLSDLPEEVAGKCRLPGFLEPEVDFLGEAQAGGPSLEMGAAKSRARLQLNGPGRTAWTTTLKGQRLVAMWPQYVDLDTFGPQPSGPDATSMVSDFNPFNRFAPQISHVQKWNKRMFGDGEWDWDGGRSFGPRQGAEHLHPVEPAECVVNEGELLVTFDSWHAAYSPLASVALSGSFVDRYAAPGVAWVDFLHSNVLNYWKDSNSAMALYRSIGQTDPEFMPQFLEALAARAKAAQADLEKEKKWTYGRFYEESRKNYLTHREGGTPWGQPGKAFFESSGYWPLFSAWAEGVVPEIPAGFFEHELFRVDTEGETPPSSTDGSPSASFDGEF